MKIMLLTLFWMVPALLFSQNIDELDDKVFKKAQISPLFPGCEDIEDKREQSICAGTKLLQFVYSNVKYPKQARKKGVEGTVVVKFIVEKDGSISNAQVVRDIGEGCGEEALRVVSKMPNWTPGSLDGKPVRAEYQLPVKFILN